MQVLRETGEQGMIVITEVQVCSGVSRGVAGIYTLNWTLLTLLSAYTEKEPPPPLPEKKVPAPPPPEKKPLAPDTTATDDTSTMNIFSKKNSSSHPKRKEYLLWISLKKKVVQYKDIYGVTFTPDCSFYGKVWESEQFQWLPLSRTTPAWVWTQRVRSCAMLHIFVLKVLHAGALPLESSKKMWVFSTWCCKTLMPQL